MYYLILNVLSLIYILYTGKGWERDMEGDITKDMVILGEVVVFVVMGF